MKIIFFIYSHRLSFFLLSRPVDITKRLKENCDKKLSIISLYTHNTPLTFSHLPNERRKNTKTKKKGEKRKKEKIFKGERLWVNVIRILLSSFVYLCFHNPICIYVR